MVNHVGIDIVLGHIQGGRGDGVWDRVSDDMLKLNHDYHRALGNGKLALDRPWHFLAVEVTVTPWRLDLLHHLPGCRGNFVDSIL